MDNKFLTERDTCTQVILPAIMRCGRDEMVQERRKLRISPLDANEMALLGRLEVALRYAVTARAQLVEALALGFELASKAAE